MLCDVRCAMGEVTNEPCKLKMHGSEELGQIAPTMIPISDLRKYFISLEGTMFTCMYGALNMRY